MPCTPARYSKFWATWVCFSPKTCISRPHCIYLCMYDEIELWRRKFVWNRAELGVEMGQFGVNSNCQQFLWESIFLCPGRQRTTPNFELHEFFRSPKNVHLKALLYISVYVQGGPSMMWFFDTCCRGSRCWFLKPPCWLGQNLAFPDPLIDSLPAR